MHLRVAGHVSVQPAEGLQLLLGEVAPEGQRGVQGRGAMALAEDEPVPVRVRGRRGVDVHFAEVQNRQQLAEREGAPDVAGSGPVDHFQGAASNSGRNQHQFSGFLGGELVFHGIASLIVQNLAVIFSSNYIYPVEKIKYLYVICLNLRNSAKNHRAF